MSSSVYDSGRKSSVALQLALQITQIESSNSTYHLPIILGCPWSSLSTATSPILNAFNFAQISSAATSPSLSSNPSFYRSIPSDLLQAEGLILLCTTFNWTKVAVIYVNDPYGIYLSVELLNMANKHHIDVTAIAISIYDEQVAYIEAAQQIKELGIYIIITILHDSDISTAFEIFQSEQIMQYPYYFIGCDAWFDSNSVKTHNVSHYTQGFIGTRPWNTVDLPLDEYKQNDIKETVNQSMTLYNEIYQLFPDVVSSNQAIYGYDSLYALVYAMQDFLTNYDANISAMNVSIFHEIMTKNVDFIGLSGHILFDEFGDRVDGIYSFGNLLDNGTMQYFGYFRHNESYIDFDLITWPNDFVERGTIPRSDILIIDQIITINHSAFVTIFVFVGLSILFLLTVSILICMHRSNPILISASWRLTLLISPGCLLAFIGILLYGVDEATTTYNLDFLCNVRVLIMTISYSVMFMPLFFKTYRLVMVFNQFNLDYKVSLKDNKLMLVVLLCVFIDVILLTAFTSIEPLQRVYINGDIETVDAIQRIQYFYGSCTYSSENNESLISVTWILYTVIAIWKGIETLFGVYCALLISRIGMKEIAQFDETKYQLLSILVVVIILSICIPMNVFGPRDDPTYFFVLISIVMLLIANVTFALNLLPRLISIMLGNEDKFLQDAETKLQNMLKEKLKKLGWTKVKKKSTHIPQAIASDSEL